MNTNEHIHTIGDFVRYLQTLDQNASISADYIQTIGSTITDIKERPLLKSVIEPIGNNQYKLKTLFY